MTDRAGASFVGALVLGAALALAAPSAAPAETPPTRTDHVLSLDRGLICNPPSAGRRAAPDTIAGWVHLPDEPLRLIHHGTTAPALLGMGFGVEFILAGQGAAVMRYTVTHPPMAPEGQTAQGWESTALRGEREAIFFQFDIEDELLPGRWEFSATVDGTLAFRAGFDVVAPETVPHLTALCRGAGLLSLARP